MGKDLL